MKKRHSVFVGVLVTCFGLTLGVLAVLPPSTGVTKANYDRIEKGMTKAEVEAVFGRDGVIFYGYLAKPHRAYCWANEDRSYAIILFDDDKK